MGAPWFPGWAGRSDSACFRGRRDESKFCSCGGPRRRRPGGLPQSARRCRCFRLHRHPAGFLLGGPGGCRAGGLVGEEEAGAGRGSCRGMDRGDRGRFAGGLPCRQLRGAVFRLAGRAGLFTHPCRVAGGPAFPSPGISPSPCKRPPQPGVWLSSRRQGMRPGRSFGPTPPG